jgi:hypothetical protein
MPKGKPEVMKAEPKSKKKRKKFGVKSLSIKKYDQDPADVLEFLGLEQLRDG